MHEAHRRLAERGAVVGGRVFGYRNRDVFKGFDVHGRPLRSHVERLIEESEGVVVRRIFQLAASGLGKTSIAKRLNQEGAPSSQPRKGRPQGWAGSSV